MSIKPMKMIRRKNGIQYNTLIFCLILAVPAIAQVGQIEIGRVQQMPNLPTPYLMRDWKDVARKYDEFIFTANPTGEFLPLIKLKSSGVNYPAIQPILFDTYVGTTSNNQAEAINIIPSVVGASLMGIDKSNQDGTNWALKTKDFFNKANGQNVYLNGYSTTSGKDWWYDLMPNVYFYQLYSLYPTLPDFSEQFSTIADQWLQAVHTMGGSTTPWTIPQMNYRGWYLSNMTPNDNGVKEPESAGTIAWLLYHAYTKTGEKKYLEGSQMAMDFLSNQAANPSYELQLPYGTLIAAKMNATLGTHYDIEKMVNWSFDRGALRGWGTIVGTWNGSDVSGLVGEANDAGNDYAFVMNGFQQAAALVPMVKYDKRFARAIAKWTLNMANASRFFYSPYLPQTDQDDFSWSSLNDTESVIAYESLKEDYNGKKLYATGDAKNGGWAQTNLSLYSSSGVGYLGALIETTDIEGILLLDLNKTDFFGEHVFPSYVLYNPYSIAEPVTIPLGAQTYDVYDAISETIIMTGATGNTIINVPADEVMLLVYLPSGSTPVAKDGKLFIDDEVVDYHFGYGFEGRLRIKSLEVENNLVEFNQQVPIYSTVENATNAATYSWFIDGVLTSSSEEFTWDVPEIEGTYKVLFEVSDGVNSAKDSINLTVVENIPTPPTITGFTNDKLWYYTEDNASIICKANNKDGGTLVYSWTLPGGTLISQNDSLINWSLPVSEGLYQIICEVANEDGLKTTAQSPVLVKKLSEGITSPVAYYPLDGDVRDYSGNNHDASLVGAQLTTDSRGENNKAYKFSSASDIIFVENEAVLNFQDQITLSFWVKLDAVTGESFILSHGSWEERWKVSVTPDKKLRWTVKTSTGTTDLDSSFPLLLNHFYHFAVVYSGYSMELFADGVLDTFSANDGLMATTGKAITFGKKDVDISNYYLRGTLDEVRIYDKALAPNEIMMLPSMWSNITAAYDERTDDITLYPNPTRGSITITGIAGITNIDAWDIYGRKLDSSYYYDDASRCQMEVQLSPGMVLIKIETPSEVIYRKIMMTQ